MGLQLLETDTQGEGFHSQPKAWLRHSPFWRRGGRAALYTPPCPCCCHLRPYLIKPQSLAAAPRRQRREGFCFFLPASEFYERTRGDSSFTRFVFPHDVL